MKSAMEIAKHFLVEGEVKETIPMNSGHINTTSRIIVDNNGTVEKYTVQAINTYVFKNPEGVMENIAKVTAHIREKLEKSGGRH